MAGYGSKDARLLVGAYDLSAYVDNVTAKTSAVMDTFHPIGSAFPTAYDTGTRNGELTFTTLYDGVYSQYLVAGTSTQTTLEIEGGTAGTRAYCFPTPIISSHEVAVSADQLHRFNPEVSISGDVNHAFVAAPLTARSTASNTDAADADGLASSTGATAFLHVTALTLGGYTNVIVTPRSSSDGVTYANCSSSFTANTAVGSQTIALTGTVERYLSAAWAWTGSGSGQSVTFAVYIARD